VLLMAHLLVKKRLDTKKQIFRVDSISKGVSMRTDTALRCDGMKILVQHLGIVDAERFIYLVNKEPFDYTQFRHTLFEGMSLEDICREAKQAKIEADEKV